MSAYELYLLLHIGGAIVWIGSAFLMAILGTRGMLARDSSRVVTFAGDSEWLGLRLYLPANLLVLASGLLIVHEGNWGYGALWIKLGLAGLGLSFAMGAAFFGPGWTRARKLAESEGRDSPALRAAVRRLLVGSWLDLGLLLGVVFVMTIKPSEAEGGALAVAAAIPVVSAVLGIALAWAGSRRAPDAALARASSGAG